MLVSLFDYDIYLTNFTTLLNYENKGIDFSDVHSYSQGKYMTSAFSESKPNATSQ